MQRLPATRIARTSPFYHALPLQGTSNSPHERYDCDVRLSPSSDARSLALHRAIAERIRRDPSLVARAQQKVSGWRSTGGAHVYYCNEWDQLLQKPIPELVAFLESDDERSRELRQVSPFAGVLEPRERWRILRETKEAS